MKISENDDGTVTVQVECIGCKKKMLGFTGEPGAHIRKKCVGCGQDQGVFLPGFSLDDVKKVFGETK